MLRVQKGKVDRGDIFDLQLPHFGCEMVQDCCEKSEQRIKNGTGKKRKRERRSQERTTKLLVDEAISKRRRRRSQTKLMGSHFNCKKVTVSLIPMRQCVPARSNKSEPVRISKIIVCHCVNTKCRGREEFFVCGLNRTQLERKNRTSGSRFHWR